MGKDFTGATVHLTAAVGDVVKSTALLPGQKAEVNRLIAEFVREVRGAPDVLHAKHNGDGFIIYGLNALKVVEAALQARHKFRTTDWARWGLASSPQLRIGVDGGTGTIGDHDGLGYEASGEGIERAARLEPVTDPDAIWCSETVLESLSAAGKICGTPLNEKVLAKGAGRRRVVSLAWCHEAPVAVPPNPVISPPDPAQHANSPVAGVSRQEVPLRLFSNGTVSLVQVQLSPPPEPLQEGVGRPEAMAAVRALFNGVNGSDPALDAVTGPHLIHFPELAFDVGEWRELDEQVRARNEPLVLITGFGPASGRAITDWSRETTGTQRVLCLAENERLGTAGIYNGGWCWVHSPGGASPTYCFCFLKNYRDQRIETSMVTQEGRTVLALHLQDLILLPAICADLLSEHDNNPQARFARVIDAEPSRPVLVTGNLWEAAPWHQIWTSRLDQLVKTGAEVVVALTNRAIDSPRLDDTEDAWRARTGVYMAKSPHDPRILVGPFSRQVETPTLTGGVARRSTPSILFGRLGRPPYGPTTGRHLWEVTDCLDLATGQLLSAARDGEYLPYEFVRFLDRHMQLPTSQQNTAITEIKNGHGLKAELLAGTCLHGLGPKGTFPNPPWDCDKRPNDPDEHLQRSAKALCYLAGSERITWCDAPGKEGQLDCTDVAANILVWSGDRGKSMSQKLRDWTFRTDPHPPLIAVAYAKDGLLDSGPVVPNRHTDWPSAPAEPGDIAAERGYRFAKVVRMAEVMDDQIDDAERHRLLCQGLPA